MLAKSRGRQAKENAMRRKRLARLLQKLRALRKSLPERDQLLLRIGAAKKEAGRSFGFVQIRLPKKDQEGSINFRALGTTRRFRLHRWHCPMTPMNAENRGVRLGMVLLHRGRSREAWAFFTSSEEFAKFRRKNLRLIAGLEFNPLPIVVHSLS